MNNFLRFLLAGGIFFLVSCSNSSDTKSSSNDSVETVTQGPEVFSVEKAFPRLVQYLRSEDSSFATDQFEGGEMEAGETLPPTRIDTSALASFRPYLVYNSDSTMAVDAVSYNYVISKKGGKTVMEHGGPDTEVALLDLRNNTRKRILFLGSSGILLEAKWEDEDTIIIAAAEDVGQGMIRPSIWRYHISTGKKELYRYRDAVKADIKNYTEGLLNQ